MASKFVVGVVSLGLTLVTAEAVNATSVRNEEVYQAVETSRAETLELLKTIVNIDSGSGDVAGGKRVESILAARIKAIGGELRYMRAEAPGLPPNLVGVFHGHGKAKILIIAHIDTVFGPGTVAKRPFRVDGGRAYGPGVGDEKGGAVNAIMALKILHDLNFREYATVTLLLDSSEELGSTGSTELIKTLAAQSDVEFNMEPGAPPDALTVWRKGGTHVLIQVRGRAAHAGMAPEDGRNAATELANQLVALNRLFTSAGDGTTTNLTVIRAGERPNVIPDFAEATLDVRFRQSEEADAMVAKLTKGLAPKIVPDTTVTVTKTRVAFPPLTENPQIDALGAEAQAIYAELGAPITLAGSGGGSESSIAMSVGTPALDGLGDVGAGFHTDREWIDVSSVSRRLYLLTRLLMATSRSVPIKAAVAPGRLVRSLG
jgi:glutamate carboxypeptidase